MFQLKDKLANAPFLQEYIESKPLAPEQASLLDAV